MFEHTQGEWSIDLMEGYEDGTDLYVLDSDGFPIATIEASPILHNWHERYPDMPHWADGAEDGRTAKIRSREEVEANANLMRAAPDLLEALDELAGLTSYAEIVGGIGVNRPGIRKWCDKAFDAIRKARGQVSP